jgi:glycosyltransferase involved in cell wall biosynthesis
LQAEGRVWEAETPFVAVNPLVDLLYGAAPFVLLPYTEQYCLTGTLVEAVALGKPVLAPDIGWMGARIREHGIGLTYRHRDLGDLRTKLAQLQADPTPYAARAAAFGREFQRDRVDAALAAVFGDVSHA